MDPCGNSSDGERGVLCEAGVARVIHWTAVCGCRAWASQTASAGFAGRVGPDFSPSPGYSPTPFAGMCAVHLVSQNSMSALFHCFMIFSR